MLHNIKTASDAAHKLIRRYGTRDPQKIATALEIEIETLPFKRQKGVYTVLDRQPVIIVKEGLHPITRSIVIAHELGHHILHQKQLKETPYLQEFNIFDMTNKQMEYEANLFVSALLLPDDEVLEYIQQGYNVADIAKAMNSDINLVALKVSTFISQGKPFREQEYRNKIY